MTGAEYKTRREAFGLSAAEAAEFHRLKSDRTIRHWESGRSPVPEGAAAELLALDRRIDHAAGEATAHYREQLAQHGQLQTIELYRYSTPEAYAASRSDREGLPIGSHPVLIDRTRRALEAAGAHVAILYTD